MNQYNCPDCSEALVRAQERPDIVYEDDKVISKTEYHCPYCAKNFVEEIIYSKTRKALVYLN